MLKIYLIGFAITVLYVCICYKISNTKVENIGDALLLLFIFASWFITMPIILAKVIFGIYRDVVQQRG